MLAKQIRLAIATGAQEIKKEIAEKEAAEACRQTLVCCSTRSSHIDGGLLDRSAFIEWLRWRNHEYPGTEPNFKIGPYPTKNRPLSYKDVWGEAEAEQDVRI
jgi:hypothetical protein